MKLVAEGLACALAVWLVAIQPFAGRQRYRRLQAAVLTDPGARLHHYRTGVARTWLMAGVVSLIWLLTRVDGPTVRIATKPPTLPFGGTIIEVLVVTVVTAIMLRFSKGYGEVARRMLDNVRHLLPATSEERRWFVALSVTAGIGEELLLRGFGIAFVRWLAPGTNDLTVVVVTSAVFGFLHLYQGLKGIVLTGLMGAVFAGVVLGTGSLVPAMVFHALVDLRILAVRPAPSASAAAGPTPADP